MERLRVAILGGGIAGLASAYHLARAGARPVVFEASDHLGGLGATFEHEGAILDRFYHVLLDSDDDLIGLMGELGLAGKLVWANTGMGFHIDGRLQAFDTPLDLLRFRALTPVERLRTGLAAFYITTLKKNALALDDVRARDWLVSLFGRRVYDRIWDPLLAAKFGDRRDEVPAYWVWNTLNREKNGSQEVKGYIRGGYALLTETLREAIVEAGGEIRLRTRVERMEPDAQGVTVVTTDRPECAERFDRAISTLPLHLLRRVLAGHETLTTRIPEIGYQGVVNAVVVMKQRLERHYWTAVIDRRFPFQGVVETTHVVPLEQTGGRHLLYLMNYCSADTETYGRPDDLVERQAVDGLSALYPSFDPRDVESVRVFRAREVEPVWTLGYLQRRPPSRLADSSIYLCTTAQAYPRVTAWNTSVALARETVDALLADAPAHARPRLAA